MSKLGNMILEPEEQAKEKYCTSFSQVYTHTPSLVNFFASHNDEYFTKSKFYFNSNDIHCPAPALYLEVKEENAGASDIYEKLFYDGNKKFSCPKDRFLKKANALRVCKDKKDPYYSLINTIRDIAMGMCLAPYSLHPFESVQDSTEFDVLIGIKGSNEFKLCKMGVKLILKEVSDERHNSFSNFNSYNNIRWIEELYKLGRFYPNYGGFTFDFNGMDWEQNHLDKDIIKGFNLELPMDAPCHRYAYFVLGLGNITSIDNIDYVNPKSWLESYYLIRKNLMKKYFNLLSNKDNKQVQDDEELDYDLTKNPNSSQPTRVVGFNIKSKFNSISNMVSHDISSPAGYNYSNFSTILDVENNSSILPEFLPDYPEICSEQLDCVDNLINILEGPSGFKFPF